MNNTITPIFVYQNEDNQDLKRLEKDGVISFNTYADFSENSDLNSYIRKLCFTKGK